VTDQHHTPMSSRWFLGTILVLICLALSGCPSEQLGQESSKEWIAQTDSDTELTTDAAQEFPETEEHTPENTPEPQPEPIRERPPSLPFPSAYAKLTGGHVLKDENPDPNIVEVTIEAKSLTHQLTPKHTFEIYAFNGMLPGPIIETKVGDELVVHFTNQLKEPTTIHWHGQRVPEDMDGVSLVRRPVQPGKTFTYRFKVSDAGTYWYHPHVHSHEQVEKGLYGMLVVREKQPLAFTRERALLVDDILLTETGLAPFHPASEQEKVKGRIGSHFLLNGKPAPATYQAKTGERERWRIVNTANASVFRLEIKGGAQVRVIGVDSGLLAKPFSIQYELLLSPGQRYDLEVMYEKPGTVELNTLVAEGPKYVAKNLLRVQVSGTSVPSPMAYPTYPEIATLPTRKVTREETLAFELLPSPDPGGNHWKINGQVHPVKPLFTFKTGDVVLFTLQNMNNPNHPFHLHGQFFEIISRNGLPVTDEPGLRDTVLVSIQERVVIKAYLDNPGRWMFHCHNLEHAHYGMMAHIKIE